MKIVTVVGARPQFIKAAAGSRIIRREHKEILVHTGQHFDKNMSDVFFDEMNIPKPDYTLGISGGTHGEMTGKMLVEIEKVLLEERPDALLVYGDTNSTLAGALAAVKLHIPVFHVEAGNRLGTLDNPEEVNRIMTDCVSTLLFCATDSAMDNLRLENLVSENHHVFVVGNIMYDSFLHFASQSWEKENIVDFDGNRLDIPKKFYYMTCHRQENTYDDVPLNNILSVMNELDAPTIYPVHPRNQERAKRLVLEHDYKNILLAQPVKYSDSIHLTQNAQKIVTDSGGLQCEAFFAGVQCVFIFDRVAWPETMVHNRNQLAAPERKSILDALAKDQVVDPSYQPFGDGHAAERILEGINKWMRGVKVKD